MSTGLLLDGVFASEAIDSSGEILDIKGLDVSDFDDGKGVANYEHQGHDNENNQGQEIVGKVIFSKKIFSASDCSNDREKMFWEKVKLPFLYGIVRLYDGAGHEGAKALAAIIRDSNANSEPIIVGFSIEGSTLDKDSKTNRLKSTIARRVALTLRPCNKTAVSGLLADPNAPDGYDKLKADPDILAMIPIGQAKKSDHEDPRFARLGGSEALYGSAVFKATVAGSYNSAPGTLTGGAALQKEDEGRQLRANALAAVRDWSKSDTYAAAAAGHDPRSAFRKFLKARMPEASDEFLDHFSDIVDNHMFRIKKAQEVVADLAKAGRLPKKTKKWKYKAPKGDKKDLKIQGIDVPKPPSGEKPPYFKDGVLTTESGVFETNTPHKPHSHLAQSLGIKPDDLVRAFDEEMNQQRPHHQKAMENWMELNQRWEKGAVHPDVVSHAVAFALNSPGIKVPMQEFQFGHWMDTLKNFGIAAPTSADWRRVMPPLEGRKPGFQEQTRDQPEAGELYTDLMARNRQGLPQHTRPYFEEQYEKDQGRDTKGFTTKTGGFIGFNKMGQFGSYYSEYLKNHHDEMMNLIRNHPGDTHRIARYLTTARGFAPKLARYTLGLMGAGNIVVPDTHFIANYFGGRPDGPGDKTGGSPDTESMDHIKEEILAKAKSHDLLEAIDKHYFDNHHAVHRVLADPVLGPYFKGREEQAIFPAFWWHWTSIPGIHRRIGTPNRDATNDGTDHTPFLEATWPYLRKSTEYDPELPLKTAAMQHRWLQEYGANHALGLYHRFIVPMLMENAAKKPEHLMRKFEELQIDLLSILKKAQESAATSLQKSDDKPADQDVVEWQGNKIRPGRAVLAGGSKVRVLDADQTHITAVPEHLFGRHGPNDIQRIAYGPRYIVSLERPQAIEKPAKVDLSQHAVGDYVHHPESKELAEGFDFAQPMLKTNLGSRSFYNKWANAPNGKKVFVKREPSDFASGQVPETRAEAVYSNLARDFWGLGQYVPPVALVKHPQTGEQHAIMQFVPGGRFDLDDPGHKKTINHVADSGDLDKISMMDSVMGNMDRHEHNFLIDPESNKIHLIDNGLSFNEPVRTPHEYWDVCQAAQPGEAGRYSIRALGDSPHSVLNHPVHPEAIKWAIGLSPEEFATQLRRHEIPVEQVQQARRRLMNLQDHLKKFPESDRKSVIMNSGDSSTRWEK